MRKQTKRLGKICLAGGILFTQVSTLGAFSTTAYAITDNQMSDFIIKADKDTAKVAEEITLQLKDTNQYDQNFEVTLPKGMSFNEEATMKLNEKNTAIGTIRMTDQSVIQIERKSQSNVLGEVFLAVKAEQAGNYTFTAKVQRENNEVKVKTQVLNVQEDKSDAIQKAEVIASQELPKEISAEVPVDVPNATQEENPKQAEEVLKETPAEATIDESDIVKEEEPKQVEEISKETPDVTKVDAEIVTPQQDNEKVEQAAVNGEVDAHDEKTFKDALENPDISKINITESFIIYQSGFNLGSRYKSRPNLTIEGNNHTIDFRGHTALFRATNNEKMNLTFKNARVLGGNYYGFVRMDGDVSAGVIKYENIDYEGAQITASYEADVEFAGEIKAKTVTEYTSIDGSVIKTQNGYIQQNIEATNVRFLEGTHYTGTTLNAAVFGLKNGGTVDVGKNAVIDITAGGTGGEDPRAAIVTEGDFIVRDGAKVNIYTTPDSNKGGINARGRNSKIKVFRNAELNIHTKGKLTNYYGPYSAIYLGNDASLEVADSAKLTVRSENTQNSTVPIVYAGDRSSFIIGKKSTFDVYSDGTGYKYLIQIGSSAKFQFANAERVNLTLDNSDKRSRLIYMSNGLLDVDVQRVKAWNESILQDDESNIATKPNYVWNPMYGMKVQYSGGDVKEAKGNSLTDEVQNDFRTNFRTQNFKRVLFEYIPDVGVSIDALTDNKNKENSNTITGITNPGAWVRLSGDPALPKGEVSSPDVNDKENYHAQADATGKYTVKLPKGKYLTAGNTVKAYAYLNGKFAEAATVVKDETAPDKPTIEDQVQDVSVTIKGKAEANSTVTVYSTEGDAVIGTVKADEKGTYTFIIPEDKKPLTPGTKYYVTATDAAENISEKSDTVTVIDTLPPTADPVTQVVILGESLSNNPKDYVTNVQDNAGVSDGNISYKVTKKPDVSELGYVEAEITITDAAKNSTRVIVPVFVTDGEAVVGKEAALQAKDFEVIAEEVPTDDAALRNLVLKEAKVKAWGIPGGADITSQVQILDKGGLTNQIGDYSVTLKVKDVEKTIKVSVSGGNLELVSVPQNISFGEVTIQSKEKVFNRSDMKGKITVSDKRKDKNEWQVYVKQVTPLTSTENDVLQDAIVYSKNGIDTVLNEQNYLAHGQTSNNNDNVSLEWKESEGIRLKVAPGPNVKVKTKYHGELEWTLTDAPI
ncbi:pectate lyase-like adhesive domain-containing protein [Bacillus cereus group sp. MYBK79-1]|uniref:pectate lyase-like adhesive domain-containing protein n=1 Tax=unclassified Bacillus cereus group TaxID=2750818 RepID=UPI003F78E849